MLFYAHTVSQESSRDVDKLQPQSCRSLGSEEEADGTSAKTSIDGGCQLGSCDLSDDSSRFDNFTVITPLIG